MSPLSSRLFKWPKGRGTATLAEIGQRDFPKSLSIRSARTNKVQDFVIDHATMENHEFFDGEATAYVAPDGTEILIWC